MNETVNAALEQHSSRLRRAAIGSADVAKTFMGLVGSLVSLCNRKGTSMKDVRFGPLSIEGERLKSRVTFGGQHRQTEAAWEARNEFKAYARRKALRMAKALEDNPSLSDFLGNLIEAMEQYGRMRGKKLPQVAIERAVIDRGDMLVMDLKR